MASTNRTPNLGLNSWIETDRPKRVDFVSDNNLIDSFLGTHLNNTTAHLTQSEKDKVGEPFKVQILYGTGSSSTNMTFEFAPTMVIAFKISGPVFEYDGTRNLINTAVATKRGSSYGISLSDNMVTFFQGALPDTSYYNNMNEQYSTYAVIAFK